MDKQKAIEAFGNPSDLARALGCTPSAIYQWPDVLPPRIADRVIAAAVRTGKDVEALLQAEQQPTAKAA